MQVAASVHLGSFQAFAATVPKVVSADEADVGRDALNVGFVGCRSETMMLEQDDVWASIRIFGNSRG